MLSRALTAGSIAVSFPAGAIAALPLSMRRDRVRHGKALGRVFRVDAKIRARARELICARAIFLHAAGFEYQRYGTEAVKTEMLYNVGGQVAIYFLGGIRRVM